ncbi:MAG: DUF4143 domain-containing protein [Bacteroidia bacterium]
MSANVASVFPQALFQGIGRVSCSGRYFNSYEQLLNHRALGASWEGYVIEQIRRTIPERWQLFFYRTHAGAEADLVMLSPSGKRYLVEIKRALSAPVSRGFFQVKEDLQPEGQFVIVPEGEAFPRSDGTIVCGLMEFLEVILPGLG